MECGVCHISCLTNCIRVFNMRPTGALMLMCKGCEGLFHVTRKFYSCRNASCGKRQRVCVSVCIPLCHNLVEVALMVVQRKEKQA